MNRRGMVLATVLILGPSNVDAGAPFMWTSRTCDSRAGRYCLVSSVAYDHRGHEAVHYALFGPAGFVWQGYAEEEFSEVAVSDEGVVLGVLEEPYEEDPASHLIIIDALGGWHLAASFPLLASQELYCAHEPHFSSLFVGKRSAIASLRHESWESRWLDDLWIIDLDTFRVRERGRCLNRFGLERLDLVLNADMALACDDSVLVFSWFVRAEARGQCRSAISWQTLGASQGRTLFGEFWCDEGVCHDPITKAPEFVYPGAIRPHDGSSVTILYPGGVRESFTVCEGRRDP